MARVLKLAAIEEITNGRHIIGDLVPVSIPSLKTAFTWTTHMDENN